VSIPHAAANGKECFDNRIPGLGIYAAPELYLQSKTQIHRAVYSICNALWLDAVKVVFNLVFGAVAAENANQILRER
jgi:hypothetical protein